MIDHGNEEDRIHFFLIILLDYMLVSAILSPTLVLEKVVNKKSISLFLSIYNLAQNREEAVASYSSLFSILSSQEHGG
jgi:membrane-anchored glycerophosphoryl diester phosphodiesterase (GDPDase)